MSSNSQSITVRIGISGDYEWPNGKPISSIELEDGRVKHTLEDGRAFIVSTPNYRLDYQSTWIGSVQGDTYSVNVAIVGLCEVAGFFTCWNFDIGELRCYAFHKTVRLVHLETGEVLSSLELEASLNEQGVRAYVEK